MRPFASGGGRAFDMLANDDFRRAVLGAQVIDIPSPLHFGRRWWALRHVRFHRETGAMAMGKISLEWYAVCNIYRSLEASWLSPGVRTERLRASWPANV